MTIKIDEGKLISGKDALIALANGEEVEYWCETDPSIQKRWTPIKSLSEYKLSYFLEDKPRFEFRIKPRTITINGIEVPACGEDYKEGEEVYVLDDCCDERGYIEYSVSGHNFEGLLPKLWWRTEEEIKQVVSGLRQVFGGSHDN